MGEKTQRGAYEASRPCCFPPLQREGFRLPRDRASTVKPKELKKSMISPLSWLIQRASRTLGSVPRSRYIPKKNNSFIAPRPPHKLVELPVMSVLLLFGEKRQIKPLERITATKRR